MAIRRGERGILVWEHEREFLGTGEVGESDFWGTSVLIIGEQVQIFLGNKERCIGPSPERPLTYALLRDRPHLVKDRITLVILSLVV